MSRSLAAHILDRVPDGAYHVLFRRPFTGLYYHLVSSQSPPHYAHLGPCKTPEMFESDLQYLTGTGRVLPYDELAEKRRGLVAEGTHPRFLITFDDGYAECASSVAPLLRRYGVSCIFFVTTGFLDNSRMFFRNKISLCVEAALQTGPELGRAVRSIFPEAVRCESRESLAQLLLLLGHEDEPRVDEACDALGVDVPAYLSTVQPYLTSRQVMDLAASGFSIGSHTVNHPHLGSLGTSEAEAEIVESSEIVRKLTGQDRVPFAFPFSGGGVRREFLTDVLKRHPFIGPVFDTGGMRKDAPYIFRRVWADPRPDSTESNLPLLIRAAYRTELRARLGLAQH